MSGYDERPWLALYREQPADCAVEFDNALDMFSAGVAQDPDAVASGTSTAASPDAISTSSATPSRAA